ncbi:hypothetical protein L6164_018614 [Bauhinia variegata]|uniref:Uncharacterized protein n=1 Tax=Bauhinia variegata TaxID=167791 RepID=A0ACB9ND43_BAUVA|nr:hypothetical protein L6164_018614 [Bauhinia variegata]
MLQMESQSQIEKASSRRRSVKSEKLSLEDYIEFLHSHQTLRLNVNQLNQIIRIHGFKRIHRAVKKNLINAVDKLDLMDLRRSTLSESVSSFAILNLEEAIADLDELDWKECCVTSIQILNNCKENFPAPEQNNQIVVHCQPEIQTNAPKMRTANENCYLREAASKNVKRVQKMVPKRKRVNSDSLDYSSTMDCVSLASC